MPNTFFKFKQFTIHQDKTSMKVGTDGVLLGAWVDVIVKNKVLDVGVGTGLLSLMLAQRNSEAAITGIEIDKNAFEQAKSNVEQSIFKGQIKLFFSSFQDFETRDKYDLIVCNPPFFNSSFLSGNEGRDMARQSVNFDMNDFFEFAFDVTNEEGEVAIVYPFEQLNYVAKIAVSKGFFIKRQCLVKGNQNKPFKRVLFQFSKQEKNVESSELCIEDERHQYTGEFTELVKDFYLNL